MSRVSWWWMSFIFLEKKKPQKKQCEEMSLESNISIWFSNFVLCREISILKYCWLGTIKFSTSNSLFWIRYLFFFLSLFVAAGVLEMTGCESTVRFSGHTLDKATKAKVILENYYSNLVTQHLERKQRWEYFFPHFYWFSFVYGSAVILIIQQIQKN